MSRALKYDIPGPDWRVAPESVAERGWGAVFGPAIAARGRLVVDVGFGRGEFLMHLAERSPDTPHVGIEYSYKRVLKMTRRLARTKLENVRLLDCTAERAVNELFEDESVACFWVNYPDPWPKKRHARRRLLRAPFVRRAAECLVPGGMLHCATDHPAYAEEIDEILAAEPLLENVFAPDRFRRELACRLPTAYELEWRAAGRALHFFSYRRRARGGAP